MRRADGYVGVEHLLRALADRDGGGPVAAAVRRATPGWLATADASHAALRPQRSERAPDPDDPAPTPRLLRFGEELPEGFDIDDLAGLLLDASPIGVVEPGAETVEGATLPGAGGPADGIEVLGGPEDGRRFALAPGAIVGRAGGGADVSLYAETRLTDVRLSRRHLQWDGERLLALHPILGSPGLGSSGAGLAVGDVVSVTAGTRLRGIQTR